MDAFLEKHQKIVKLAQRSGVLSERIRILNEIEKIDLPVGVWFLIRPAFRPDED